jgi:hypothetical protein
LIFAVNKGDEIDTVEKCFLVDIKKFSFAIGFFDEGIVRVKV